MNRTPAMTRKPLTQEEALSRWHREAANIRRVIDEGKALNSIAGRMYPQAAGSGSWRKAEIPRLGGRSVPDSVASRIFPHLPRERSD
jgi:hypothetical protein